MLAQDGVRRGGRNPGKSPQNSLSPVGAKEPEALPLTTASSQFLSSQRQQPQ